MRCIGSFSLVSAAIRGGLLAYTKYATAPAPLLEGIYAIGSGLQGCTMSATFDTAQMIATAYDRYVKG